MGKVVVIFVIVIAAIFAVIILNTQQRSEEIPEMLANNFKDLGSYALQYAVKQVSDDSVASTTNQTFTGDSAFNVLNGTINSIEYIFEDVESVDSLESNTEIESVTLIANISMSVNSKTYTHDSQARLLKYTGNGEDIMMTFPIKTVWAVNDDNPPKLHYYTLSEEDSDGDGVHDDEDFVHLEGEITGIEESSADIEAFTIGPDGIMYFINNINNSGHSVLYKINPEDPEDNIDMDESTDILAQKIKSYPAFSGNNEITNLEYIDGLLYGIGKTNKEIYSFDPESGTENLVANLNVSGTFRTDALTIGADGFVYLNKTKSSNSELWKFEEFPDGIITQVCVISGSGKVEALAAHPEGTIFAADDERWYEIDPASGDVSVIVDYEFDIEGIDFYYTAELNKVVNPGTDDLKIVYWKP